MKKFWTFFMILTKHQLKNIFLFLMLLCMPVCALIINTLPQNTQDGASYDIGVYADGSDLLSLSLAEALYHYEGSVRFVPYQDLDLLYRDIKNTTLTGGYVLPSDLSERSTLGQLKNCILSLKQPSSTIQTAINEIVYAEMIKLQGEIYITDYVTSTGLFQDADYDYIDELLTYYDDYVNGDETFHILYQEYGVNGFTQTTPSAAAVSFPLRGVLAILIFLAALFGCVTWQKDREKGIFETFSGSYLWMSRILYIFIPALLFAVSAIFTLIFSKSFTDVGTEIGAMLFYLLILTLFCLLLSLFVKKSQTYTACIPILLLCCLVFCPVFVNISNYIPAAKVIEKLLMPYYYLRIF